jgi:carbonic anhydrase/acetyltransferase-like protein (isoleucine patch superfamily)
MAKTRDSYLLTARTVDELARNLNFLLQRFADRIDRIEGIRGTASIESDLDMNSNRLTEVGAASDESDALILSQATGSSPTFTSLTVTFSVTMGANAVIGGDARITGDAIITGDADITGNANIAGNVIVVDSGGVTIHSLE